MRAFVYDLLTGASRHPSVRKPWRHNAAATLPLLIASFVLFILAGCNQEPTSNLPTVSLPIGKTTFTLEIASGGAARGRGLMFRDSLASDHGMIFCFGAEQELTFWMHNTRIPLDIVYLDAKGRIVSIRQMKPYEEKGVPSNGMARFAIELNEGKAAEVGIKAGDILTLPPSITTLNADP